MADWIKQEGIYEVLSVADGGFSVTKNGNPYIELVIELNVEGTPMWGTYTGFFTEKTRDITAKEMAFLGFNGRPKDLIDGSDGLFVIPKNVTATVKAETSDQGKTFYKINWINMRKTRKAVDRNQIESLINQNNLDGLFMKFKDKVRDSHGKNFETEKVEDTPF